MGDDCSGADSTSYRVGDVNQVAVIGDGVVGARLRRRLGLIVPDASSVVIDSRRHNLSSTPLLNGVGIAVLARPAPHLPDARALLDRRIGVVSIGDQLADVRTLLSLNHLAQRAGVPLVVGAGMSTGLSGLLARLLAADFSCVDEVRIGLHGTAGPACARQHHRALAGTAVSIIDGREVINNAGTGRELVWFPEPVGAYDCYRAEITTPIVLTKAFPRADRITVRVSATRRDRLTSRLPMLSPPHPEGGVGAVRVEVSGVDGDGGRLTSVAGAAELVGTATAATAGAFLHAACNGRLDAGVVIPGSERLPTVDLLRTVERLGVRLQSFTGVPSSTSVVDG